MLSGVYNEDGPYVAYIDVKKVAALSVCQTSPALELGGGMNLHDVIHTLETLAEKDKNYFYGKAIGAHLRKVSNEFLKAAKAIYAVTQILSITVKTLHLKLL